MVSAREPHENSLLVILGPKLNSLPGGIQLTWNINLNSSIESHVVHT